ncbi:MAG TPA: hypothetical protein VEI03_03875 [Stellaceae bacterium]|nr:hypothetical protein [Stellaceae bacterium]
MLDRPEYRQVWHSWADEHPPARTPGLVNQALDDLPMPVAVIAIEALNRLSTSIAQKLDGQNLSREDAILLDNDLGFIRDVAGDLFMGAREAFLQESFSPSHSHI